MMGTALESLGSYTEAVPFMDRAILLQLDYAPYYGRRAILYGRLGFYKEAIEEFDHAYNLGERTSRLYANRGLMKSKIGNLDGALSDFNSAIAQHPDSDTAYLYRAVLYMEDYKDTLTSLELISKRLKKKAFAEGFHLQAMIFKSTGESNDKVLTSLSKAIKLYPTNPMGLDYLNLSRAYINRGQIYALTNMELECCKDLYAAWQLGNEDAINYAFAIQSPSELSMITNCSSFIADKNYQTALLEEEARKYIRLNEIEKAVEKYDQAILLGSTRPLCYAQATTFAFQLGKSDQAEKYVLKGIELIPEYDYFYILYSEILGTSERYVKAIEMAKKYTERQPKDAIGYIMIGKYYEAIGDANNACINFEKAKDLGNSEGRVLHFSKCR
jgi:tetratricopeptide (TPR) repeat protein